MKAGARRTGCVLGIKWVKVIELSIDVGSTWFLVLDRWRGVDECNEYQDSDCGEAVWEQHGSQV